MTEISSSSGRFAPQRPVVIIGGGPAGLTAAYELTRRREPVVVCERDSRVGGLAQTVAYKGFRFDIGGHRFFTKVGAVREIWRAMLGDDLLTRPRLSRIFYRRHFFDYPLRPLNAIRGLGPVTTVQVVLSYLWVKLRPVEPETNLEDWVTNRFGRRLYRIFFEAYTQKVWGIPPRSIDAQWAAQRIRGLSLKTATLHMLRQLRSRGRAEATVRSLVQEFEYPRLGPGMMWEAFRDRVLQAGGRVEMESPVVALHHDGRRIDTVEVVTGGARRRLPAAHVISTMPIVDLVRALQPAPPPSVLKAAVRLKYRDFLTVALILDVPQLFPDNWIYVHDAEVKVGRIQNFKNWSPEMVPDSSKTCLGLEYFCFEGDGLWAMRDEALVALATRELAALGIAPPDRVLDGTVVRMPKAYPVYDEGFAVALRQVREHLGRFENLQLVGRNGMHKYNNQDHSMFTAMLTVENIVDQAGHDIWTVNVEEEYHEEKDS